MTLSVKSIVTELNKDNPNLIKAQQLLYKLQDENEKDLVRFRVNGSLINRLGAELVERKETAICELIKNSYDADSKKVNVIFDFTPNREKIIIEDFGNGMTRDEIAYGFMVIGTDNKIEKPVSPKLKRRRAGSKGIGRIAGYRLGKSLEIETKAKNEKGYKVTIDWTQFENQTDISFVRVPIEEGNFRSAGTQLTITNLQDIWTEDSIKEVYKFVADLFQPEVVTNGIKVDADSFEVNFIIRKKGAKDFPLQSSGKLIFDYAHAEIDAWVTGNGTHKIKYKSKQYKLNDQIEGDTEFSELRGVYMKAYYFLHGKAGLLKGLNKAKVKQLIEQGRFGIRVYRNGFRVLPFGEPENDWLGLDQGEAKRKILIPSGNKNFFGFISINDSENRFVETSNREGFVQNDLFDQLVKFGIETCYVVSSEIGRLRGKKIYASQKDFKSGTGGSPKVVLADIENKLANVLATEVSKGAGAPKNDEEKTKLHEGIREHVSQAMSAVTRLYLDPHSKYSESLLEENSMLRVLATLGISVAEFTHEMRLFVPALENDIENIKGRIRDTIARSILDRMRENVSGLSNYVGFFDNTIVQNTSRVRTVQNVSEIVEDFKDGMEADFARSGISVVLELKDGLRTIPMHYSEWTSLLFNFYTNSKKAIKKNHQKGTILIKTYREDSNIVLEFQDNGSGVPDKIRNNIFEAFVSTTKVSELRKKGSGDMSGSGLGLWIARQIVESYGGDVRLSAPKKGFSTSFKVAIPAK